MVASRFHRLGHHAGSVGLVVVASLLAVAIGPALEEAAFLLLLSAVVAASWFGGLGPGLTAAVAGAIVRHLPGIGSHAVDHLDGRTVARAVTFATLGALVAMLAERSRRSVAEAQLRRIGDDLKERVRQRAADLTRINDSLEQEVARRARVEKDLEAERAWLQAILNQMPSALVIADARSGHTVLYNDEVARQVAEPLSPWRDIEAFGRSGAYHDDGEPLEPEEYPLARALAGDSVRGQDLHYRRGDGTLIWRSVNAAPIRDPDGTIIAAVCISLDVTERRRAEALRAELWGQLAAVQERERSRLARDLHDRMGQHLTAVMLGLAALEDGVSDGAETAGRLRRLHDLAGQIGHEVHRIAWELRPTALDDLGLPAAVKQYVEEWSDDSRVPAEARVNDLGPGRLPPAIETALYRIVQEALTNVARHACARRVRVVLGRRNDYVFAVVEDDGRGFEARAAFDRPGVIGRLGLLGMRERASLVGGTLEVESRPGEGTIILTTIPLPETEEQAAHG